MRLSEQIDAALGTDAWVIYVDGDRLDGDALDREVAQREQVAE